MHYTLGINSLFKFKLLTWLIISILSKSNFKRSPTEYLSSLFFFKHLSNHFKSNIIITLIKIEIFTFLKLKQKKVQYFLDLNLCPHQNLIFHLIEWK
jgi:hypothetical protein